MIISIFPMLIMVILIMVISISKNTNITSNNSPRLIVEAVVVSKRVGPNNESYYLTFQFESGDRMELRVNGKTYGMLVAGDYGKLTFQGHKYINFDRSAFITDNNRF